MYQNFMIMTKILCLFVIFNFFFNITVVLYTPFGMSTMCLGTRAILYVIGGKIEQASSRRRSREKKGRGGERDAVRESKADGM